MPLARAMQGNKLPSDSQLVFVDDSAVGVPVNGYRAITWPDFVEQPDDQKLICLAIANSTVRERLAIRAKSAGVGFFSVMAANTVILDDVILGEGSILCPFVTLTSNIRIGCHFHANLYSYVEHDCVIGDFVTFAPGVKCNGNVVIEDHAYIGAGAVIKQGAPGAPLIIGRGAVVGMGAVVTRSIPAGVTVAGNPAKPLVRD